MPTPDPTDEMTMHLAADLDARTVTPVHAAILSLLDAVEESDAVATLELDPAGGDISPLSAQLLVSASRSFPADRLTLGEHASAALASFGQPKEI